MMRTDTWESRKHRIFDIISLGTKYDRISCLFDYVLVSAIIINLLLLIVETFDAAAPYMQLFKSIEWIIVVFLIIYCLFLEKQVSNSKKTLFCCTIFHPFFYFYGFRKTETR